MDYYSVHVLCYHMLCCVCTCDWIFETCIIYYHSKRTSLVKHQYIYPPLKRSFKSTVRIIALVLVASRKFKKLLVLKQIERKEKAKDALKELDFQEQKFTVFNIQDEGTGLDIKTYRYCHQTNNWSTENWSNIEAKFIRLTDEQLSAAQEYLFNSYHKNATKFNCCISKDLYT